uniref:Uncharacterized protein n=1 Tax=Glossina austeni TaxID=7395 RepID=A0A1A9VLM3_GLOAU
MAYEPVTSTLLNTKKLKNLTSREINEDEHLITFFLLYVSTLLEERSCKAIKITPSTTSPTFKRSSLNCSRVLLTYLVLISCVGVGTSLRNDCDATFKKTDPTAYVSRSVMPNEASAAFRALIDEGVDGRINIYTEM